MEVITEADASCGMGRLVISPFLGTLSLLQVLFHNQPHAVDMCLHFVNKGDDGSKWLELFFPSLPGHVQQSPRSQSKEALERSEEGGCLGSLSDGKEDISKEEVPVRSLVVPFVVSSSRRSMPILLNGKPTMERGIKGCWCRLLGEVHWHWAQA